MKNEFRLMLLLTVLTTLLVGTILGKEKDKLEVYTGVVVGTGGTIGGRSMNLDIKIDRHTSVEDIRNYISLLKSEGHDALRRKLEKEDVGRISPAATTGTDLAIARVFETSEGKLIRLLAARPMRFLELYHGGRSTDYPFTIIEIRLNEEGKGEGTILGGARVEFNKEGQLEIESFGNQYAKLRNVRSWK